MTEGWTCTILNDAGPVELSQLDGAGREWYADGPGGTEIGDLHFVLTTAAGWDADTEWLAVVEATVIAELGSVRRSQLLVSRATGRWFRAAFSRSRQSISDHGLDYRRMVAPGIAGSAAAEAAGAFFNSHLDMAQWFAHIGSSRGQVDIWAVDLIDVWLVGDPGAGGGSDDSWMICPTPIDVRYLTLLETVSRPVES